MTTMTTLSISRLTASLSIKSTHNPCRRMLIDQETQVIVSLRDKRPLVSVRKMSQMRTALMPFKESFHLKLTSTIQLGRKNKLINLFKLL